MIPMPDMGDAEVIRKATLLRRTHFRQKNSKPALPRAFCLLCYLSQLLAGIFDVCLRFVGARRRAPMPSHRCRHTASSSAPPLRLSKMQGAPPAPRFSALLRNYRGVAHFHSAVSFRGSNVKPNDPHAGHECCGPASEQFFSLILCECAWPICKLLPAVPSHNII